VIAPDKAHFYPEYIPERYLRKPATRTNYQSYLEEMDNEEVDYVDFNSYFLTMKDKSEYPLFPKNGSHWSDYGAIRAFDSLVSVLEIRMEMNLPDRIRDSIFLTSQTLHDDNDMIRTSNLIWEPGHPDMALELFHYRKEAGTRKPKALFVGDSFYWQWYHPGLLDSTFSTRQFWYYDKEILPYRPENPKVRNLDLQEVLFEQNVIILLQTMGGNCKLGYGFVERAYRTFIMGEGRMLFFEELIRNSPKWMEEIKRKAKEWNMAVEKVIEKDAKYMVFMESQKKKDNK